MAISKDKCKLQISITNELNEQLDQIIKQGKIDGHTLTKSQLVETALRWLIQTFVREHSKEEN